MNASVDTRPPLIFGLPESVIDFLIPIVINLIFIAISALLFWPIGKIGLALRLAQAFVAFWLLTLLSVLVISLGQRLFRVSSETRVTAFVISNLIPGAFLLASWSGFAVIVIGGATRNVSTTLALVLWLIAILSSITAFVVVTTFYRGTIYALVNLLVVVTSMLLFGLWPSLAETSYGWLFNRPG